MSEDKESKEQEIEQVDETVQIKELEIYKVLEILEEGTFNSIIGAKENQTIEFKSQRYQLKTTKQKFELAKDVSSLANTSGGVIIIGIKTRKHADHSYEYAEEIRPFEEKLINIQQYFHILETNIYPGPNCEIKWVPSINDSNKGLVYIRIPEADTQRKPFIVTKVLDEEKELGSYVGFFQRKGDNISLFGAEEMYHSLKDGLRFDEHLSDLRKELEELLSIKYTEGVPTDVQGYGSTPVSLASIPTDLNNDIINQRINDAIETVGLTDDVAYVLVLKQAYPVDFSRGDVTDFFGTAITRQPRAA